MSPESPTLPSEPPSGFGKRDSWRLAVLIGALLPMGMAVFRTPRLLDEVVKHQQIILPLLAIFLILLIMGVAIVTGTPQRALLLDPARGGWATIAMQPRVLFTPKMLPFTTLSAGILTLGLTAVATPVIPKTLGLEPPSKLRDEAGNRDLLLFIHGWNGDAAGTWKQFPSLAATDPKLAKYNVWVLDYPTFMLRRNVEIVELGAFFDRYLDDTADLFKRYDRIVVIAHSMGGLVARDVSIQHKLRKGTRAFTRLIEIATPHNGASVAGLAAALGLSRGFAENMRSGSPYLKGLTTYWYALTDKPFTFCIGSPHDRVVSAESATEQCTDATKYLQGGHTEIVKPASREDVYYSLPISQVP